MCVAAIILAAGWGSFKPGFPKVLESLGDKSILETFLQTVLANSFVTKVVVVVNPNNFGSQIEQACEHLPVEIAYQEKRTGAAGAVASALPLVGECEDILVGYPDMPLWRPQTMRMLVAQHLAEQATVSMVTVTLNGSHRLDRYGRVIFDEQGVPLAVFEPDELAWIDRQLLAEAKTVNPSLYVFNRRWVEEHISHIVPVSKDGFEPERHLPRLIPIAHGQNRKMVTLPLHDETEALGINTQAELEEVRRILAQRQHNNNHNGGRP
jgi:bifunctional UDP-N-acetylglucosamine pyrophosphorylase/glucosamine-1-phosphate N-acetyltransferase